MYLYANNYLYLTIFTIVYMDPQKELDLLIYLPDAEAPRLLSIGSYSAIGDLKNKIYE